MAEDCDCGMDQKAIQAFIAWSLKLKEEILDKWPDDPVMVEQWIRWLDKLTKN